MNSEERQRLHKAINECLADNLAPALSPIQRIGLRELLLDAIEGAGFSIVPPKVSINKLPDYSKIADSDDWPEDKDS